MNCKQKDDRFFFNMIVEATSDIIFTRVVYPSMVCNIMKEHVGTFQCNDQSEQVKADNKDTGHFGISVGYCRGNCK